jgi:hypothetical protein
MTKAERRTEMNAEETDRMPERLPSSDEINLDIRRLLSEIAASLRKIEAAFSPSGYAHSLFEAIRLLNITLEHLRIAGDQRLLTKDEREVLDAMYPEKPAGEKR